MFFPSYFFSVNACLTIPWNIQLDQMESKANKKSKKDASAETTSKPYDNVVANASKAGTFLIFSSKIILLLLYFYLIK